MPKTSSGAKFSRRKLLKSIAAGGGITVAAKSLPGKWTKPVVQSVVLPAHAATSPVSDVCLIRLVVNMSAEGSAEFTGFYGYSLTDEDFNSIESDLFSDVPLPVNIEIDFELPPGIYFLSLTGLIDANTGTGSIELRAECCSEDFVADETSGDLTSGIDLNIGARVEIIADGICDIEPADVG
jgi:hypothetical protein